MHFFRIVNFFLKTIQSKEVNSMKNNLYFWKMKKNIAIITGGDSGEYEISISSGQMVSKAIDNSLFNTYIIEMRYGNWIYQTVSGEIFQINKNNFSLPLPSKTIFFDCIFIAIHGTPGEDGKLQGYFDMIDIPYTSCGALTSALTCSKGFCNRVVRDFNIVNVPQSQLIFKKEEFDNKKIINKTGLPCFVKPNRGGSSVAMSKVEKAEDLEKAIAVAFEEDNQVLVEQFIKGRELTCGVYSENNIVTSLPVTEVISKNDFFDFEAKYNSSFHQEVTPANIPDKLRIETQEIAKKLYVLLNCEGVVRIDFIVTENNELWFLEVNTVPGMTDKSIVPQQVRASGLELKNFYTLLINEALKRKN